MTTNTQVNKSITATPTASAIPLWDANKNLSAVGMIEGFTTTVTSASPVTLTVASNQQQFFTGSTAQTVIMPVASTLVAGMSWYIVNQSSAVVTVESSGTNTIIAMAANTTAVVTCILNSGTDATSWFAEYEQSSLVLPLSLANGGTGASLAASNGGIFYSTGSAGAILAGTATAGQIIRSGASTAPTWSTSTYPATAGTAGNVLTSDGTNWNSVTAGSFQAFIANGRLTLTSGLPVTTADVTAATTVYFTPYLGNQIALFDGSATWNTLTFAELSFSVPATTSTMYDVFAFNNSGVVALDTPLAWTNDTTRATALVLQNGVYVKSGATTRRYIGSFRTTTVSGQTEDSLAKRYVWNYNNRVNRPMKAIDSTSSWTYTSLTFRQADANTANQLDMVIGVSEDLVIAFVNGVASQGGASLQMTVGLGINSTSTNSAITRVSSLITTGGGAYHAVGNYVGYLAVGRNTLVWLEASQAVDTTTWYGASGTIFQSGIIGFLIG